MDVMRRLVRAIAVCVFCLAGSVSSAAVENSEMPWATKTALFGDDEEQVLEYLKRSQVPEPFDAPGPATFDNPISRREVERALELFKNGSDELRLAVAQSLFWASERYILEFWNACGPNDIEAKHYFIGIALENVSKDKKKELRTWLLEDANLKYAAALLKNLSTEGLFDQTKEAEKEEIYRFLIRLYGQPGLVVKYKGTAEDFTISASIQTYVVLLLPRTERAWDILLDWMVADGRKADKKTLEAMWRQWRSFQSRGACLKEEEFFNHAASLPELAECWLRSPYRPNISQGGESWQIFRQNLWKQIFNEDRNIRKAAITLLLDYPFRNEAFDFIKGLDVIEAVRKQAMVDAEEAYSELRESVKYRDSKRPSDLEERYRRLQKALQQ
jgi:hypothetical protein